VNDTVTYHLIIIGLDSDLDGVTVSATLEAMPGVHHAYTLPRAGRCIVDADPTVCDPHGLAIALTVAGYPAEVDQPL
jgi:hypothetical protein